MSGQTVLEARGLTKRFGAVTAVDGISFRIRKGEIVGLLGPNGAGKTTTIQMLMGLITPSAGEVEVFGLDLAKERTRVLQRVNFSSSYVQLPFSLSVRENLLVFGRLYGVKPLKENVERVVAAFDLGELEDRPTKSLSSGQLTRLHLAKALLNRPELLFLDEPTASLDPDTADRVRTRLRQVRAEAGLTILVTSHNMREMEALCDRIVFLYRGRILLSGSPKEIVEAHGAEDLEALFVAVSRGQLEQGGPA